MPTTPAASTKAITQAKPVDGLKGVYSIETVVIPNADNKTYKVSYDQLIDFLKHIPIVKLDIDIDIKDKNSLEKIIILLIKILLKFKRRF